MCIIIQSTAQEGFYTVDLCIGLFHAVWKVLTKLIFPHRT